MSKQANLATLGKFADAVNTGNFDLFAETLTGTHQGPLAGIGPTGRKMKIRGLQFSRFKDGKMVERWGSSDQLGLLTQLGVAAGGQA
jgi:predicted ester cyclase